MRLQAAICMDESGLATADLRRIPGYVAAVVEAAERLGLLKGNDGREDLSPRKGTES